MPSGLPACEVSELQAPDGGPTSYLLGTMHLPHPDVLAVGKAVWPKVATAQQLILEIRVDSEQMWLLMGLARAREDLEQVLGTDLFQRFCAEVSTRGGNCAQLRHLKLWVAAQSLAVPRAPSQRFSVSPLDLWLGLQAEAAHLPLVGLETAAEQVGFFEAIPVADQVQELEDTLNRKEALDGELAQMLSLYLAGDLVGLEALTNDTTALDPKWKAMLLDQRNAQWLSRLPAMLSERPSFVAVGAAHLVGPHGLLVGLTQRGFHCRPVPLTTGH